MSRLAIIKIETILKIVFIRPISYTICKYDKMICLLEVHMVNTLKLPVGIDSFEKYAGTDFIILTRQIL